MPRPWAAAAGLSGRPCRRSRLFFRGDLFINFWKMKLEILIEAGYENVARYILVRKLKERGAHVRRKLKEFLKGSGSNIRRENFRHPTKGAQ